MAEKTTYVIELNDKLSPGLKKATAKALGLDKAMGGVGKKAKKSSGGINTLGTSIKGLVGPLALAAAGMKAFQFASESIAAARKFESLTNAINFASGSIEEGAKTMDFLRQRSRLLGTDLLASTEGFKTLSAAMLGSSLEGQATKDIFDGVQVAASAMGLSSDQAKGTFLALGQIMGKGKVQAEELRGQIGERIPGAFNIAARAMGVTTQKLDKMLEQGQLLAEDFLPKFSNELKKTFGKALPTAAESAQAKFNRFNNTMLELKLTLGNALMPVINRTMTAFKTLINFLKTNSGVIMSEIINPIKSAFLEVRDIYLVVFQELASALGFAGDSTAAFIKTMQILGKVVKFTLGVVKLQIKVVATLFRVLIKAFSGIFQFLTSPIETAKTALLKFANFFTGIFSGIKGVVQGVLDFDINKIKEGLKTIKEEGLKAAVKIKQKVEGFVFKAPETLSAGVKKDRDFSDVLKQSTGGAAGGSAAAGALAGKKSTSLTGVKSGRPTHINIDIGKLIENFNITTQNMEETTSKVGDKISQVLLSAVNNVNNIAQ